MINLLPPTTKNGYRFARHNVSLRRWVIIFVIALAGLGAIVTYGTVALHQSTVHYQKQIDASNASLDKQDYKGVQKQVADISSSFKLAVQVLSKEVLFSELLQRIGAIMPAGSALSGISLATQDQGQGAFEVQAMAVDYHTATQVQVNLADPTNKIFSKADIESIDCFGATANADYPCNVHVRALFASDNPYYLINSDKKVAKP
jgi:hypothetical protein